MKKIMNMRLLFAAFIFFIQTATAQIEKGYLVRAGEVPTKVLPQHAMYLLPAFREGVLFLKNGKVFKNQFNFNFLYNEAHFIGAKNDTLSVKDPLLIKTLMIDSMVFYFDNGYLREFFKAGKFKLAMKQQMVQVANKAKDYDVNSGASEVNYYVSTIDNIELYRLKADKDVLFKQQFFYYIGDVFGDFLKATKKNFNHYFSKKNITGFIKENHINFNKAEDLEALLKFCVE